MTWTDIDDLAGVEITYGAGVAESLQKFLATTGDDVVVQLEALRDTLNTVVGTALAGVPLIQDENLLNVGSAIEEELLEPLKANLNGFCDAHRHYKNWPWS